MFFCMKLGILIIGLELACPTKFIIIINHNLATIPKYMKSTCVCLDTVQESWTRLEEDEAIGRYAADPQ